MSDCEINTYRQRNNEDNMSSYQDLIDCWLSGQMNAEQLRKHRESDPGFDAYFKERLESARKRLLQGAA